MAYGVSSGFWANLYVVWFVCDCVMVKDRFHGVLGLSETEHCVPRQKNPEHNGKRGCVQISAHPCESASSTSNDHNFPIRTPICTLLDSTESSLSIKFNRIKYLVKTWAEHWAGSRTVKEWSILVYETSIFGIGLYMKCLRLRMA